MRNFLLLNLSTPVDSYVEVPYLWLTLHSYFKRNSRKPDEWNWLDPIHSSSLSEQDIIETIINSNVDVLGISCYVWNLDSTLIIAEKIKKLKPSIKIIGGGAALYYERDIQWFKKHWFIDAVCEYSGYGEIFITEYLDGSTVEEIPYCVYPSKNRSYWKKSPVEYNKRNFKYPMPYTDNIEYLKSLKSDKPIKVILETSRGCPYSCVYCEWGGGTATKVIFNKDTQNELETALSLKPEYVDITNANFGIVEQDIEFVREMAKINSQENFIKFVTIYGPTKTNKKNLFEIYKILLENNMMDDLKLSVQHTDDVILKNIKRTDASLVEQVNLFQSLSLQFNKPLKLETILGMPGETLESFYQLTEDMTSFPLIVPLMHEWMQLPSAPAASDQYVKDMQIKTKKIIFYKTIDNVMIKSKVQSITTGILDKEKQIYDVVTSTYSYSEEEWVEMELFKYYFSFLTQSRIILPIYERMKERGVSVRNFNRKLYSFLLQFDIVQKSKNSLEDNLKKQESDILYADIAPNLPYISHYSVLKFLILLSPDLFFDELKKFIANNYGNDNITNDLCDILRDNIVTPMKTDKPPKEKIIDIISLCKTWTTGVLNICARDAYNEVKQRHS